ncbi:hypothetical protein [Nocardiopsis chromatogenes]|uniref:hypothetical protein n=1 Tax=Nocardiopsis chromatogenes TaxID=280239 RepID=UPI00034576DB|nr:hypothetical protein [Nocardiopsis chromatogenes]
MKKHWKKTSVAAATVLTTCTLLPTSSYADEAEEDGLPVVATSEASDTSDYEGSKIEVNQAQRSGDSDYVTITWTMTITGDAVFEAKHNSNNLYRYNDRSVSSVTVTDEASEVRYHPLQDTDGFCLCTGNFYPSNSIEDVEEGQPATFWNSYMIPQETEKVSLSVPGFAPAKDIPIE